MPLQLFAAWDLPFRRGASEIQLGSMNSGDQFSRLSGTAAQLSRVLPTTSDHSLRREVRTYRNVSTLENMISERSGMTLLKKVSALRQYRRTGHRLGDIRTNRSIKGKENSGRWQRYGWGQQTQVVRLDCKNTSLYKHIHGKAGKIDPAEESNSNHKNKQTSDRCQLWG